MTPKMTNPADMSEIQQANALIQAQSPVTMTTAPVMVAEKSTVLHVEPKDIRLPPSPPFDSDDEFDLSPRRPTRPVHHRPDSDSSTSTRPVIHQVPIRSRNPSPHTPTARPYTSAGFNSMPLMQRAHSSPGIDSSGRFITIPSTIHRRPSSPLSAGRRRSPLRAAMEESYPVSWSGLNIEPNIPEHAELELSPALHDGEFSPIPSYTTLPRARRRPTSPLHASASAPTLYANARAASPSTRPGTHSPMSRNYYANEPYPGSSFSSVSSMPSTPSSFRSRSPSISSLETIEDTPDAEEAARRAEEDVAKDRLAEEEGTADQRRRSSLELRGSSLRSNKERKRWSVCGAERRADFSLEPIEE